MIGAPLWGAERYRWCVNLRNPRALIGMLPIDIDRTPGCRRGGATRRLALIEAASVRPGRLRSTADWHLISVGSWRGRRRFATPRARTRHLHQASDAESCVFGLPSATAANACSGARPIDSRAPRRRAEPYVARLLAPLSRWYLIELPRRRPLLAATKPSSVAGDCN